MKVKKKTKKKKQSVCIGSFSGPYFRAFGLNTERYRVSLRIQSKCEKIKTRKLQIRTLFTQCKCFSSRDIVWFQHENLNPILQKFLVAVNVVKCHFVITATPCNACHKKGSYLEGESPNLKKLLLSTYWSQSFISLAPQTVV